MRYIHPVGQQEQFVASGDYSLTRRDMRWGVIERWAVHEQPDGARKLRVDFHPPDREFYTLYEAWISPPDEGGKLLRLDVLRQHTHHTATNRATYQIYNAKLEIGCTLANGDRLYDEIDFDASSLLFPNAYLLWGHAFATAAQYVGEIVFFVIEDRFLVGGADDFSAIHPQRIPVLMSPNSSENTLWTGKHAHRVRQYRIAPDEFQCDSNLNEQGFLVRCTCDDGSLVELVSYAHRPIPKTNTTSNG